MDLRSRIGLVWSSKLSGLWELECTYFCNFQLLFDEIVRSLSLSRTLWSVYLIH